MKRKTLKRKNLSQLLFAFVVIVLLVWFASLNFFRLDLTAEKRYTLSPISKQLLSEMTDGVYVKIYLTGEDMPVGFKRLQKRVIEMLEEFKVYSGENIDYQIVEPPDDEDPRVRRVFYENLRKQGMKPYNVQETSEEGQYTEQVLFPGAVLIYQNREETVNFLKSGKSSMEENINSSIQALEYELTNAIRKLSVEKRQTVAFIQGHGELEEAHFYDFAGMLSEYYMLQKAFIGGQVDSLNKYAAIIIAKPQEPFSEADKYVIDQYVMQGGKVLWLVDGLQVAEDSLKANRRVNVFLEDDNSPLNLQDQLFKYGARINPDLLVDWQCAPLGFLVQGSGNRPQIKLFPWFYAPVISTHSNHPITRYLNQVKTYYVSSIDTVGTTAAIEKTILLTTSAHTNRKQVPVLIDLDALTDPVTPDMFNLQHIPIAVLLEGGFESLYNTREHLPLVRQNPKHRSHGEKSGMIIVSDGDIAYNRIGPKGEVYPMGFHRDNQSVYEGNGEFLLNAVNYLCDDIGLMKLRTRELQIRLLDKDQVRRQRLQWQLVNVLLPVVVLALFASLMTFLRRYRYARTLRDF